jgi:hypothetical protein
MALPNPDAENLFWQARNDFATLLDEMTFFGSTSIRRVFLRIMSTLYPNDPILAHISSLASRYEDYAIVLCNTTPCHLTYNRKSGKQS